MSWDHWLAAGVVAVALWLLWKRTAVPGFPLGGVGMAFTTPYQLITGLGCLAVAVGLALGAWQGGTALVGPRWFWIAAALLALWGLWKLGRYARQSGEF